MEKGKAYINMDCLDVLETLEDKMFSLIYVDIPSNIVENSERITYDGMGINAISALCKEKKCKFDELSQEEIVTYIEKRKDNRKKECEKYLIKIVQNCYRVLNDEGVIVYRERSINHEEVDAKYILDKLFYRFSMKVVKIVSFRRSCDPIYFYSKKRQIEFPKIYELGPLENFPFADKKGKYRLKELQNNISIKNFFEWNGYWPREGNGWIYDKVTLDKLNKAGYIVGNEHPGVGLRPKLKYYREENLELVKDIWSERDFFRRVFKNFVKKGNKVLSICENLKFSYYAENSDLHWYSVFPKSGRLNEKSQIIKYFQQIRLEEDRYRLVEHLENYKFKTYSENIDTIAEQLIEETRLFKDVVKEYELSERPPVYVGDTIDEILLYYIDKYMEREAIKKGEFYNISGVNQRTIQYMRNVVEGVRAPEHRTKKTILRIALHTGMNFQETNKALNLVAEPFEKNNVGDYTIMEWLCEENRNIRELISRIEINCEAAKWKQEKIDNYLAEYYIVPYGDSRKEIQNTRINKNIRYKDK